MQHQHKWIKSHLEGSNNDVVLYCEGCAKVVRVRAINKEIKE